MRQIFPMTRFFLILGLTMALTVPAQHAHPQPSSAPPSSLPVTPLSQDGGARDGLASCELCRAPEGRPGSDLKLHRRHRDKDLHPHKKAKGFSKSSQRSLKSQLPHHKLEQEASR